MSSNKSIPIKNIFYMLSYAFTELTRDEYADIAGEEFENVLNLLAAILSAGIAKQLKQGLYREYREHTEDLATVRGKINMPGAIRNRMMGKRLLTCEYDELSENNTLNRIIKTTVDLLLHHAEVTPKYKGILKNEMSFFADVDVMTPSAIRQAEIGRAHV